MSTRTVEECQEIVELWLEGEHEEVVELLGGEPSDKFLKDFAPPPAAPTKKPVKKVETAPARLKLVDEVATTDKVKTA
jgi:hypothetical protein